jgi:S1-C subfamily serine protease
MGEEHMKFVRSAIVTGLLVVGISGGCNTEFGAQFLPSGGGQDSTPAKPTPVASNPPPPPPPAPAPVEKKKPVEGLSEEAVTQLRDQVRASLVWIDTDSAYGSGFVVDQQGTIVTSAQIIEKMSKGEVTFDDRKRVEIIETCIPAAGNGLALVRTTRSKGLTPLPLAQQFPREKELVVALGGCQGLFSAPAQGRVARICPGSELRSRLAEQGIDQKRIAKFDANATWVETTAVVRQTNVGGPLINEEGRVLGISLWPTKSGQPHYVLTAVQVAQLVQEKREYLAVGPASAGSLAKPVITGDLTSAKEAFRIELPSGSVLDSKVVEGDKRNVSGLVDQWGNNSTSVTTLRYDSGAVFAITSHRQGLLNGQTVAFYEDNSPLTSVNYQDNDKHGWLQTWDQEGRRVLWSHYRFGKRHGLSCFFQDDALKVVVESVLDETKAVYIFSENRCLEAWDAKELKNESPSARASQWLARFDKVQDELTKNERMFRSQVRESERIVRQGRVTVLTPTKRQTLQPRLNQRQADHDAIIKILRSRGWPISADALW